MNYPVIADVAFAIERLETHALGWGEWSTPTLAALPLGKKSLSFSVPSVLVPIEKQAG